MDRSVYRFEGETVKVTIVKAQLRFKRNVFRAIIALAVGLMPALALAIGPILSPDVIKALGKHAEEKKKAAVPATPENIRAKLDRAAKEAWYGRSCFLPTGVDPRSFGLADDATLKCVDAALTKHFYHTTDSYSYPLHFNADSECSLVTAIGMDAKTNIVDWMKAVPAADAVKAEIPAMNDKPKAPQADPLQKAIDRQFGEKIKKLTAKQQASLSLCLYLKNVEHTEGDLEGDQLAQKKFEVGLQRYVDLERKIDPKDDTKSWATILAGGEKLKAAAPAKLECSEKNPPSFAEALLYRENYLSESYAAATAEWKKLNPRLAIKAQDQESAYLYDVRAELCNFAKINRAAPQKLTELGASIAQTHKRLAALGKPPTDGTRHTPPAWVNQYLTISVNGYSQNQPLACFVENGYFWDPLLEGQEEEHEDTKKALALCPSARDGLAAELTKSLYEFLREAEPLGGLALRVTAEAKKDKSNPTFLPDMVGRMAQAGITKTRIVVALIARGFLCPSADGTKPVSWDEAAVARQVADRIATSDLKKLELFEKEMLNAVPPHGAPPTHEFLPSSLSFVKLEAVKPHCILPDALEPRVYLTANLYGAKMRAGVLRALEAMLFIDDTEKAKLPALTQSYLWHANGRLGKGPAEITPLLKKESGMSALLSGVNGKVAEFWDRFFQNSPNAANARKSIFEFDRNQEAWQNLKRVKESKNVVLAAAILREELLNQNEAELAYKLGQGNALAATSERKSLEGLRAQFCTNLLTQGADAVESAKDLADFAGKLNALAPLDDKKTKKPVAFHEGLLRLYLDLDPVHRKQLNALLSTKECVIKYPEINESIVRHVLAPRSGNRLADRQRDEWFAQIEKHHAICEFIAALEARSLKADKNKLLQELEKTSGEKLTGERRNFLLTTLLNFNAREVGKLLTQLKSLPNDFGVVTVKPAVTEALPPVIDIETPHSPEMLVRELPKGKTPAIYLEKALGHLQGAEIQLSHLTNQGFADASHKRDLERLMNEAWRHSYGRDFSPPPAEYQGDPAKRLNYLQSLEFFTDRPVLNAKPDRLTGYLEANYWKGKSPKSWKGGSTSESEEDPDVVNFLRFYAEKVAPLRAAREEAEKTRVPKRDLFARNDLRLTATPIELLKGLAVQREETEKLLVPLRKKLAEGKLDVEEIKRIERLTKATQDIFETWLLDQIGTPNPPLSKDDYEKAKHFLLIRRLAIDHIASGRSAVPRAASLEVQANPELARVYDRGTELRAAAGAIKDSLAKKEGTKPIAESLRKIFAAALKDHAVWDKEIERLEAESNAGRIPRHVALEAAGNLIQARIELEEVLTEEIMKEHPVPTSRSFPEPKLVNLTFPTKKKEVGTWTLKWVPMDYLARSNNLADGLFAYYREKPECYERYKKVRDKKWWHSSMESYFEEDREWQGEDEEANYHMKDWLCWAAYISPPYTGEDIVERTRQFTAYKEAYNRVRFYVNGAKMTADVPEKEPQRDRLKDLINRLCANIVSSDVSTDLVALRDSPDAGERELYRKAMSFALRLPENRQGHKVAMQLKIPYHVNLAYIIGHNGRGFSEVGPNDPRAQSPEAKVTRAEADDFKKLLAQAPSHWVSREVAKGIADPNYRANFRDLYDSLKAAVKNVQKEADEFVPGPIVAPNKNMTPSETLAVVHTDFLKDVFELARRNRNPDGHYNFEVIARMKLPFEKYRKLFEGNETLGKEEVPLSRALTILKAERAVLRSTLGEGVPSVWLSGFGASLYSGAGGLDPKASAEIAKAALKPDDLAKLKELDAAMGILINTIQDHLRQKMERDNPGFNAFAHFASEEASPERELSRAREFLIGQSKPVNNSTEAVNAARARIDELYKPAAVNQAALHAEFEFQAPDGTYRRGGFFSWNREKLARVKKSDLSVKPLVNYIPERASSPLGALNDFQQQVEHVQVYNLRSNNEITLRHNLEAYYGKAVEYGGLFDLSGSNNSHKKNNFEGGKESQKRSDALLEQYYKTSHYAAIPPQAEETWSQMPPFLRDQLGFYLKDRLGMGGTLLGDSLFRRERAVLMEPWPGRTVEFFRTAVAEESMRGGGSRPICSAFIFDQLGNNPARFFKKGPLMTKVKDFVWGDLNNICERSAFWTNDEREAARKRTMDLLLELYKDHPLLDSARLIDPKEWVQSPPNEAIKGLKVLLTKEIDRERNALSSKALNELSDEDYAKQMVIYGLHMLEELDNDASGKAAFALEKAKGGIDRFSPIYSAFYGAMEQKVVAAGKKGGDGEALVVHTLQNPLDAVYAVKPPALPKRGRSAKEIEAEEASTPADPRLGRTLSLKQRLPILLWDKEEVATFKTLFDVTAPDGKHDKSTSARGLLRRVQLGETNLQALYQDFDGEGKARSILGESALVKAARLDVEIVQALVDGKDPSAAQWKHITEQAQMTWVDDMAREGVFRPRDEIPPSALKAYREGIVANYQRRAAQKMLEDKLTFGESHFVRNTPEVASANRIAFTDYLRNVADGVAFPARDADGKVSKMLVGPPWGVFASEDEAKEFGQRLNSLLQNSAHLSLANQAVKLEGQPDAIKMAVNNELKALFVGWTAAHAKDFIKNTNSDRQFKNAKAELLPNASLTDLYERCRVMGYDSFRTASADDTPPVDPGLKADRVALIKLQEEMRLLQKTIRKHRHVLAVLETKHPALKTAYEAAVDYANKKEYDHPNYVEDTPRGKMGEKVKLMEEQRSEHQTALRAEERRFSAALDEFNVLAGKAAPKADAVNEKLEDPVKRIQQVAEATRSSCLAAHAGDRLAAVRAMGFTDVNADEFKQAEYVQAANFLTWHASLRRAIMSALRNPRPPGLPAVADPILKIATAGANFGRLTDAEAKAVYEKELARATKFLEEEKAAFAPLADYGLTRDALTAQPPDYSQFKVPKGAVLTEDDLRNKLREVSRVLHGEDYEQPMAKEGWDKHPLADLLFGDFREKVMKTWAASGRLSTLPVNGQVVAQVRLNDKKDDFKITFENTEQAKERGQAVVKEMEEMLKDPKLFVDLRASANHLIDFTNHQGKATGEANEKLKRLSAVIDQIDELDGLEFKFEGHNYSGSTVAAHMASDRDLGIRSELTETLNGMREDQIWKAVSVGVWVVTIGVTIATAGAATPFMMAVHSGLGMAATVQTLHLVGYAMNDAAFYLAPSLYSKEKRFADSGPDNLIGSALFFAGGFGGALILNLGARAALVANVARAEGYTLAEAAQAARVVQLAKAEGAIVEGTKDYATIMKIGGKATLEESIAEITYATAFTSTYAGAATVGVNAFPKLVNTATAYSSGVFGRTGADYIGSRMNGREFHLGDSLLHHAAAELTTALFLGGFDRKVADMVTPKVLKIFGRGVDFSFPLKVGAAGSINVGINKFGGYIGDQQAQSAFSKKMDRVLELDPKSPAEWRDVFLKMNNLLEDREKQRTAKEEAFYQEALHSLVVDVGMFAGRASRDSARAQSGLRLIARLNAKVETGKAYEQFFKDQRHGWADFLNHPITAMVPKLRAHEPKPTDFAYESEGGAEILKILRERAPTDAKAQEIYDRELTGLKKALTDANLPVTTAELESFIDVFGNSSKFKHQPLFVMREVVEPGTKNKKKVYQGSLQNMQDWARRELVLASVRTKQTLRMNGKDEATRQAARLEEEAAWIKLLEADAGLVTEVPRELLTSAGSDKLRETVALAFTAISGKDPQVMPAYAIAFLRFSQLVIPETTGTNLKKHTPLGRLDFAFQAASPRDTVGPQKFMAAQKIGIKEYQEIFGQNDVVREVVIQATTAWAKKQRTPIKDSSAFINFVHRSWGQPGPQPSLTEKQWYDLFVASTAKP